MWIEMGTAARGRRRPRTVLLAASCGLAGFAAQIAAAADSASPVQQLSAGGRASYASFSHTCAALDAGVQCWGAGGSGQLGDGLVITRRPLPVQVRGLPAPVSALAAGGSHSCAVVGGEVLCWGNNASGQSGVERPLLLLEPTVVPSLPRPVTAIAAGVAHTCALTAEELWCWGRNEAGEVGVVPEANCRERHSVRPCRAPPRSVKGFEGAPTDLALGERHTCALVDGEIWCWGANARGQLGDGATDWRARPKPVRGLPAPADAVAAGRRHSCARVEGIAYCWGANDRGQLGVAGSDDRLEPVAVTSIAEEVDALSAGGDRTCVTAGGQVLCWGEGRAAPAPVEGVSGHVTALSVGFDHACAALAGTAVRCWGDNDFGQLGSGDAPRAHAEAVAVAAWDEGRIRDRDGDGRISVTCLGDSNTEAAGGRPRSWCDRLGGALPSDGWIVVNRGLAGATAVPRASMLRAETQVAYTTENDAPDAVMLAYGTNDLLAEMGSAEIVDAYRALSLRVYEAGALPFVALTPPVQPSRHPLNARVAELNGALRAAFPAERILDFWSGFVGADFADALHLADSGHERRARIAADALLKAATPQEEP